jgi:hypothetical protein
MKTPSTPTPNGTVIAGLPLALLESVQAHDRPDEILEDEDLTLSLPRRLGLKGVVITQIKRYEEAHAAGRRVPVSDVVNLLHLVLRRPDAEAILTDAGKRVARFRFERLSRTRARMLSALPRALAFVPVRRAARGLMRGITAGGRPRVDGKPLVVRDRESPLARMDARTCLLYAGALEEIVALYGGAPLPVEHSRCVARGDELCEWTARPEPPA